jgi:hypothetical protein
MSTNKNIFITCCNSNYVDIFKITDGDFKKPTSLPCMGRRAGTGIFENNDKPGAWVCSYTNNRINVYSLKKN